MDRRTVLGGMLDAALADPSPHANPSDPLAFANTELPNTPRALSGLEPYTGLWGREQIFHLLRRTTFGPSPVDLQAFQTQLTKRGQQMVEELQAKAVELERKKEQGTISPKDYDMQMAVLQAEQEGIAKYEQEVYDQLAKKRQDLYEPILAKVDKAMKEVATEKGLMLVFDASTQVLLYADESLDVTNLVKAKLGIPITPATPPAGGQ